MDVRCGASPFRTGCQFLGDEKECVSELIGEFGFAAGKQMVPKGIESGVGGAMAGRWEMDGQERKT